MNKVLSLNSLTDKLVTASSENETSEEQDDLSVSEVAPPSTHDKYGKLFSRKIRRTVFRVKKKKRGEKEKRLTAAKPWKNNRASRREYLQPMVDQSLAFIFS